MLNEHNRDKTSSRILITGASGFIGTKVTACLLERGFQNIRCLVRPSSKLAMLNEAITGHGGTGRVEIITGNLLSRADCSEITNDVTIIYHLAAGTGTKAFSDAYLNSVVTTRNLMDSAMEQGVLIRFVNVSSFAVYSNRNMPRRVIIDESSPVEDRPEHRAEAYCYAKVRQDELVIEYGNKYSFPYVIVRPGNVFGPGKKSIPGRVGINPFGIFMNFGGSNPIPLTYVDNCAEAIALAGIIQGIEGEVFNIVDDDLPSASRFLQLYKKYVPQFRSIYVSHFLSYFFCLVQRATTSYLYSKRVVGHMEKGQV